MDDMEDVRVVVTVILTIILDIIVAKNVIFAGELRSDAIIMGILFIMPVVTILVAGVSTLLAYPVTLILVILIAPIIALLKPIHITHEPIDRAFIARTETLFKVVEALDSEGIIIDGNTLYDIKRVKDTRYSNPTEAKYHYSSARYNLVHDYREALAGTDIGYKWLRSMREVD